MFLVAVVPSKSSHSEKNRKMLECLLDPVFLEMEGLDVEEFGLVRSGEKLLIENPRLFERAALKTVFKEPELSYCPRAIKKKIAKDLSPVISSIIEDNRIKTELKPVTKKKKKNPKKNGKKIPLALKQISPLELALERDAEFGFRVKSKLNPYELTAHYQELDSYYYREIDKFKGILESGVVSRRDMREAEVLLRRIKKSWSHSDYPILEPLKLVLEYEKYFGQRDKRGDSSSQKLLLEQTREQLETQNVEVIKIPNMEGHNFQSLEEVLACAISEFSEHLEIHRSAFKNARGSEFVDLDKVYLAIKWLVSTYRKGISLGGYFSDRNELNLSCKEKCGFEFALKQSPHTMGKFPEEYKRQHNGRTIWLHKHLKLGTGRDPRKSLRIGFEYFPSNSLIYIGYIGQHPKNQKS